MCQSSPAPPPGRRRWEKTPTKRFTAVDAANATAGASPTRRRPAHAARRSARSNRSARGGDRSYETGFRPDIEGLRAVAILAVLGFHAALPSMPGGYVGVDVFFVISGYLITGMLLAEIEKRGRFSLTRFYARRARRILPAAGVVLVATSVASAVWLSPLRRQDVAYDTIAAALNVSNWRFIAQQTDYLAQGRAESPLLHYWSLGVEEQFYLAWAPLALLVVVLAIRLRRSPVALLTVGVAVLTAVSFVTCVRWTATNVPLAYLGSPSRGWQFGVGALGALAAPAIARWWERARPAVPILVGAAGGAAVLWACVGYDNDTPYPGVAAALPTLGTVAVMLAGACAGQPVGVGLVLATRPMRAIGRLSYSWYLWHWPVLVIWEARFGPVGWPVKLALVTAAVVPAWLTLRFVENPVRLSPRVTATPWRGLAAGLASVALAVAGGAALNTNAIRALDRESAPVALPTPAPSQPVAAANQDAPLDEGHLYLPPYPVIPPGPPRPSPRQARVDYSGVGGCQISTGSTVNGTCLFGDASSPDHILLLGDSHAMEWFPALMETARPRGWAIEVLGKAGCPVSTMVIESRNVPEFYRECAVWREGVLNRIAREPRPKMIFVGTLMDVAYTGPTYISAWDDSLNRLKATGAPIVYFRDTPYPGKDIPDCVSGMAIGSDACDFPRGVSLPPDVMADLIGADKRPGVYLVDLTNALCPHATCPAVIDGILTYVDQSHITATASRILAPRVQQQLQKDGLLP
jgi:peptidoglycan/LPS O-acetylase OafA/YrhL